MLLKIMAFYQCKVVCICSETVEEYDTSEF